MKLKPKALKKALASMKKWFTWVYDPKENHFFMFCTVHLNLVMRSKLDASGALGSKHICDYPGCEKRAEYDYFPNLVPILKKSEDDFKHNRLDEMKKDGKFKKVKNYGKINTKRKSV